MTTEPPSPEIPRVDAARFGLALEPAERLMLLATLTTGATALLLARFKGVTFDIDGYVTVLSAAFGIGLLGLWYRLNGRSERIATTLICTAVFVAFTAATSTYNYMLLPTWRPLIDPLLFAIDAAFGYDWAESVALSAQFPVASQIMRWVYLSTLPQFASLVVVLGLTGRVTDLHEMISMVTLSACITVLFWAIFPSLGPAAFQAVAPDLERIVDPVAGTPYGAELRELVLLGASHVSPANVKGLVGFPSYHTVLALAALYYSRKVRWLFVLLIFVNLPMLPAILVHGGHHLVDVVGGGAVFALTVRLARGFVVGGSRRAA